MVGIADRGEGVCQFRVVRQLFEERSESSMGKEFLSQGTETSVLFHESAILHLKVVAFIDFALNLAFELADVFYDRVSVLSISSRSCDWLTLSSRSECAGGNFVAELTTFFAAELLALFAVEETFILIHVLLVFS